MYRSPDIKTLGIDLDVPKGLVVKEVRDAAAGGRNESREIALRQLNGTPVWTFGDLQYHYDKVDRSAEQIRITVERGGEPIDLPVALPNAGGGPISLSGNGPSNRGSTSIDRPLTEAEKRELGLVDRMDLPAR